MPVAASVTVRSYSRSVKAPKNTHQLPFTGRPSSTLTSSSALPAEKNQKAPVSVVSGRAVATPRGLLRGSCQATEAKKRSPFRQSEPDPPRQSAEKRRPKTSDGLSSVKPRGHSATKPPPGTNEPASSVLAGGGASFTGNASPTGCHEASKTRPRRSSSPCSVWSGHSSR